MSTRRDHNNSSPDSLYWERRKFDLYYVAIARYIQVIAFDAYSLIDVGSSSTRLLEWFTWIPDRVALDIAPVNPTPPIRGITADFFTWEPDKTYDVAMCCQVMEHLENPEKFGRKLLKLAKRVLVSVPYKWIGNTPGHLQDPIDEAKFKSWFPVAPNYMQYVYEPFGPPRIFLYFDIERGPGFRFDQEYARQARAYRPVALP